MLLSPKTLGCLYLPNRMVMAPLTRCRAIDHIPNDLMAAYYAQRATAGLIISEGTAPSPRGQGYARMPGIFSREQLEGWSRVTSAVHEAGGRIFIQLMHTGRVSHPGNMNPPADIISPSGVPMTSKKLYVDGMGFQPIPPSRAMRDDEIQETIREYAEAALNAVEVGFDGVEIHGANGYLIEQFLNPHINLRDDEYGGGVEERVKFALDVASSISEVIGSDRLGFRMSPFSTFNDMPAYQGVRETYLHLADQLDRLNVAYIHLVDHHHWGVPAPTSDFKQRLREAFSNALILCGAYDAFRAESDLVAGKADLIAFGRPFISNPDMVARVRKNTTLNVPDVKTFYKPGPEGYVDYPFLEK